jgi:hypothetical protein
MNLQACVGQEPLASAFGSVPSPLPLHTGQSTSIAMLSEPLPPQAVHR